MDTIYIVAALCSALLHATWNAAVKSTGQHSAIMTGQMLVAALVGLPVLFFVEPPELASLGWIAASAGFNVLGLRAILRAYDQGEFGLVYPMSRAIMIMLVVPLSTLLAHEQLSSGAMLGIGLIISALAVLALGAGKGQDVSRHVLIWTGVGGVLSACTVLIDAHGIRQSGSPFAYGCVVAIVNATNMTWQQRRRPDLFATMRQYASVTLWSGVLSMASYLLIVWVFSKAPIAGAAALRDTSSVFAVLIAMVFMKEAINRTKLLAVGMALAAIPLMRLV
ncbi:MAG: EamA family transporter [Betaproteobacteria bacterium]